MLQAISTFGGKPMLDKAEMFLNKYPVAKIAVNGLLASKGSSIDRLKAGLNDTSPQPRQQNNSFRSRLDNLR